MQSGQVSILVLIGVVLWLKVHGQFRQVYVFQSSPLPKERSYLAQAGIGSWIQGFQSSPLPEERSYTL